MTKKKTLTAQRELGGGASEGTSVNFFPCPNYQGTGHCTAALIGICVLTNLTCSRNLFTYELFLARGTGVTKVKCNLGVAYFVI